MKIEHSKLPHDFSRPFLVYYIGRLGESVRIFEGSKNYFLATELETDLDFCESLESNHVAVAGINTFYEILHWEYL